MHTQEINAKFDELLSLTRQNFELFTRTAAEALKLQRPLPLAVDEDTAQPEQLQLDMALLAAAPFAAVPRHAPFHPLQDNGHRFLLATDGLYLEVRRPWLHLVHPLAPQTAVTVPYGALQSQCSLDFGKISTALPQLKEFAATAAATAPIEAAASLLWNHKERTWRLATPETIGEASESRIQYRQVECGPDESLVIDLHSHGHGPAYFSATDNEDDRGSVKIAGVFGDLDKANPTVAFRLCMLGLYIPINVPAELIFG
jgi:PRTRC genetic system protein A